eukprot:TRINITY_DN80416_c0_g1_i1.p1 TRINITY_DN80416_c0_g1~~TRINITY_DN80416_c0_g1_i1.p1  ORF type:complete len:720 (-),score=161.61 TRINITY_DN80416_c0_g1_i1:65-2224(-)
MCPWRRPVTCRVLAAVVALALAVAVADAEDIPSAEFSAVKASLTTAFVRARVCIDATGLLDLFDRRDGVSNGAACLSSGVCPSGAARAGLQCVAPAVVGQTREVQLTVQLPCSACVADEGWELTGHIWIAVARMLRVPLEEIAATRWLRDAADRTPHALERFALAARGEEPFESVAGGIGPKAGSKDLFVAFRVHTSRVPSTDTALQVLSQGDAGLLAQVAGGSEYDGRVHIFEFAEQAVPRWRELSTEARFRFAGLAWDEDAPETTSTDSPGTGQQDGGAARDTAAPTEAPTPSPPTVCPATCPALRSDGWCNPQCNNALCDFDGGDCDSVVEQSSSTTPASAQTSAAVNFATCSCFPASLGNGRCESFCNTVACAFDGGDCPTDGAASSSTSSLRGSSSVTQSTSSTSSRTTTPHASWQQAGDGSWVAANGAETTSLQPASEKPQDASPMVALLQLASLASSLCILILCCRSSYRCIVWYRAQKATPEPIKKEKKMSRVHRSPSGEFVDNTDSRASARLDPGAQSQSASSSKATKASAEKDAANSFFFTIPAPPAVFSWSEAARKMTSGGSKKKSKKEKKRSKGEEPPRAAQPAAEKTQETKPGPAPKAKSDLGGAASDRHFGEPSMPETPADPPPVRKSSTVDKKVEDRSQVLMSEMERELDRTRSAPVQERKRVFHDLQRRFHPDKNMASEESEITAVKLVFQRLMERRRLYLAD